MKKKIILILSAFLMLVLAVLFSQRYVFAQQATTPTPTITPTEKEDCDKDKNHTDPCPSATPTPICGQSIDLGGLHIESQYCSHNHLGHIAQVIPGTQNWECIQDQGPNIGQATPVDMLVACQTVYSNATRANELVLGDPNTYHCFEDQNSCSVTSVPTPTITVCPTGQQIQNGICINIQCNGGGNCSINIGGTPTPTPTSSPTSTPTPSNNNSGSSSPSSNNGGSNNSSSNSGSSNSSSSPTQAVLGASTMAGTGTFENTLMSIMFLLGALMLGTGYFSFLKEKKL